MCDSSRIMLWPAVLEARRDNSRTSPANSIGALMVSELAQRELVPFLPKATVAIVNCDLRERALIRFRERRDLHKQFL